MLLSTKAQVTKQYTSRKSFYVSTCVQASDRKRKGLLAELTSRKWDWRGVGGSVS